MKLGQFCALQNDATPKERCHTTPSEYYQWLSKSKTEEKAEPSAAMFRRVSSNDIVSGVLNNGPREVWETDDDSKAFGWTLPVKTDITTPQANMLSSLRGRLRSIVLSKSKLELPPPEAHGMRRACRSSTDVNGEGEGRVATGGSGVVTKLIKSIERMNYAKESSMINETAGAFHTSHKERVGRPTASLKAQISFHDLSLCPSSASNEGSKVFRSRAKSEAVNRREKVYKADD
uniref:Uncharacterized protein n=1 Tax=Globodera pallida TaxID=36090 RepID=A0A183BNI9_GLOPA